MGRLADAFVQSIYSCAGHNAQVQRDPKEVSISFSLRIESDSELGEREEEGFVLRGG